MVGLKGVESLHEYKLHVPVIHCQANLFEATNACLSGPDGVEAFLTNHVCNSICKQMKLKKKSAHSRHCTIS